MIICAIKTGYMFSHYTNTVEQGKHLLFKKIKIVSNTVVMISALNNILLSYLYLTLSKVSTHFAAHFAFIN